MSQTEALFYRLSTQPLERALPALLETCLTRGWRAVVRGGGRERLRALSEHLWSYRDDAFLPHGDASDGEAARQPIWLTDGPERPNDAQALFLVDGAAPLAQDFAAFERVAILFDAADAEAVEAARGWWRDTTAAGVRAVYWAQREDGGWSRKAESGATGSG